MELNCPSCGNRYQSGEDAAWMQSLPFSRFAGRMGRCNSVGQQDAKRKRVDSGRTGRNFRRGLIIVLR